MSETVKKYMEDKIYYIILVGAISGMGWSFYKTKFSRYISENHQKVHKSLGSPSVEIKRTYTLSEMQGGFSELHYLLSGSYKKTKDPELIKIGNRLRFLFVFQFLFMVYLVVYIVIPLYLSTPTCKI
jgi:hypothetical protein